MSGATISIAGCIDPTEGLTWMKLGRTLSGAYWDARGTAQVDQGWGVPGLSTGAIWKFPKIRGHNLDLK